jgi:hypothetical protein
MTAKPVKLIELTNLYSDAVEGMEQAWTLYRAEYQDNEKKKRLIHRHIRALRRSHRIRWELAACVAEVSI